MKIRNFRRLMIQAEMDTNVRQWHFSFQSFVLFGLISVVILCSSLFFGAEYLTKYLYQNKLEEVQKSFTTISSTMKDLHGKLNYLDSKMALIEEKDRAVRTYADLPEIDQDIRELGIGGIRFEKYDDQNNVPIELSKQISEMELNIDHLARKVKLELASFESIYDKVRSDSKKMKHIPSIRPVSGGYLNSGFGYRKDPIDGVKRFHHGLDFSVFSGTPIYAPADGVIQKAGYRGSFGNHIKINHGFGYNTLFLHLSKIIVKRGQKVKRGDFIGTTGNTGRSTAPHLHYEIHHNGKPQNPLDYFFTGIMN